MNDKFIIHDATDIAVIGGFGNLDGNLGLLKYNNEEIKEMIKENNNGNDNIRLIESLLGSLKELDQENQELKKQLEEYKHHLKISKEMLDLQGQDGNYNYDSYNYTYNSTLFGLIHIRLLPLSWIY